MLCPTRQRLAVTWLNMKTEKGSVVYKMMFLTYTSKTRVCGHLRILLLTWTEVQREQALFEHLVFPISAKSLPVYWRVNVLSHTQAIRRTSRKRGASSHGTS